MGRDEAELLHTLELAWRNKCLVRAPQIGSQIADRLSEEVARFPSLYRRNDEAFFQVIQTICKSYSLSPTQLNQLLRDLKKDFYRLVEQPTYALPKMAEGSAFSSLDDLADALMKARRVVDEAKAKGIKSFRSAPATKESKEVIWSGAISAVGTVRKTEEEVLAEEESGVEEVEATFRNLLRQYTSDLESFHLLKRVQEQTQKLRLTAGAQFLEQVRLMKCLPQ